MLTKEDNSELEDLVFNRAVTDSKSRVMITPARPPPPVTSQQTARMMMAQLGFTQQMINSDTCQELDGSSEEFWGELRSLDRVSTRTADTVYVYYVRSGQTEARDILANNSASDLPSEYSSLFSSMGRSMEVGHQGWRGQGAEASRELFYWENQRSELAILKPVNKILAKEVYETSTTFRRPTLGTLNEPEVSSVFSSMRIKKEKNVLNQKVVVAWFENIGDSENLPLKQLIQPSNSITLMIFIQPLKNKLLKIRTVDTGGQVQVVSPLMDGVLVSPHVVASLIRDTCLHVCRRGRLESDTCEHYRRVALQNLKNKYSKKELSPTDKLDSLFL